MSETKSQPGRGLPRRLIPVLAVVLASMAPWLTAAPAAAQLDVRQELKCLALTIYFEARGEPETGKVAVGHVVMNRASHALYPRAVCDVVRQGGEKVRYRCQFTWWCDRRSDRPTDMAAWKKSMALARRIYWDYSTDPTGGALWYHAEYVAPSWRESLSRGPKIGRHIFYALGDTLSKTAARPPGPDADDRIPASYLPD
jgi:spore germination cell wall hydrolase CwlJ-like protein